MRIPPARVVIPEADRIALREDFERVLATGQLTLGPFTQALETEFAEVVEAEFAVAVNSGTSALEIICRCIGVVGRKVIVPTNTFFATAAAVLHAGGRVVFTDVAEHMMLDTKLLEDAIDADTAAVIVVHIGGFIHPEIEEIAEICSRKRVALIEDAAHAHGSELRNQDAGTFGTAAAFSFYPTKVMTSGEGGIIVSNDPGLVRRARIFRDQGKADFGANYHIELGYNWRMSELHAALGLKQLRRLSEFVAVRRRVAATYDSGFDNLGSLVPYQRDATSNPNYYKYVVFLSRGRNRAEAKARLKRDFQISLSGEVYDTPCHLQPVFRDERVILHGEMSRAEDLCSRHFCLPVYSDMTASEAEYVVDAMRTVFS